MEFTTTPEAMMTLTTERYRIRPTDGPTRPPNSLGLHWPTGFDGGGWLVRDEAGAVVYAHAFRCYCLQFIETAASAPTKETKMSRKSTYILYVDGTATTHTTTGNSPAKALTALAAAAGLTLASQNGRYGKLDDGRSASAMTQDWTRAHYADARTTRV